MRTTRLLIMFFVTLLIACNDVPSFEDENVSSDPMFKKGNSEATVTIKSIARLSATSDISLPLITCVPEYANVMMHSGGWVSGDCTMLGKVNPDSSTYVRESCELGPGPTQVTIYARGQMMGARGDKYYINIYQVADMATMTFYGHVEVNGGTGRFEGATGYFDMIDGVINETGGYWRASGTLTLLKGAH